MGLLPSLSIDGNVLTDSMAIMEYLEETRLDTPKILPADPVVRAKVFQLNQSLQISSLHAKGL